MAESEEKYRELDEALSRRLAKLGGMPVDTTWLDAALRAEIPRKRGRMLYRLMRPATAVAASLTLLAILAAVLLSNSGGEVMASPAQMAQVHNDIVANRVPVTRVSSIEEAGRALSQLWSQSPQLPQPPQEHVMACCMKSIHDKRMACVLLQDQAGTPITMSVARSEDLRAPRGPTVVRNGVTYHVHDMAPLNMVMTERAGRWVCLIAQLPQEKLIDLAANLKF
jgi:hypothetical protein